MFLPLAYVLYWGVRRCGLRLQNALVVALSYVFYGWWDWRLLSLIALSSLIDYLVGIGLGASNDGRWRRLLVTVSISANLGILGAFKYHDFFVDSLRTVLGGFDYVPHDTMLGLVLPVGISFYTFQTMSYSIDVYRRRLAPTHDPIAFFAYVAFFPQLVAGPIERAPRLLPQFLKPRVFDDDLARDGLRQILWGLLKKVVVADNLARMVDHAFAYPSRFNSTGLVLASMLFMIQVYCDFSGYSDIAIGTGKLFGIRLSRNFAYPLFAANIRQLWRRWHISLTTWFRDYVYVPLGRNRGRAMHLVSGMLTFALMGLWHGPSWKFAWFGILAGVLYFLDERRRRWMGPYLARAPGAIRLAAHLALLLSTSPLWVLFRAPNLHAAFGYWAAIAHGWSLARPQFLRGIVYSSLVLIPEWIQREHDHPLAIAQLPKWLRWSVYYLVGALIVLFGAIRDEPFIYFQF